MSGMEAALGFSLAFGVMRIPRCCGQPMPAKRVAFEQTGDDKCAQMILTEWSDGNARTVWPKELQAMKPVL